MSSFFSSSKCLRTRRKKNLKTMFDDWKIKLGKPQCFDLLLLSCFVVGSTDYIPVFVFRRVEDVSKRSKTNCLWVNNVVRQFPRHLISGLMCSGSLFFRAHETMRKGLGISFVLNLNSILLIALLFASGFVTSNEQSLTSFVCLTGSPERRNVAFQH